MASDHDEDRRRSDEDGHAPPASGFTAVNGKSSPPEQAKPKHDQEPSKKTPEATPHRQLLPNNHDPSSSSAPQREGRPVSTGQERRISPAPPSASAPNGAPPPYPNSTHPPHHESQSSSGASQPPQYAFMSPPKRKRSLSQERAHANGPIYPGNAPPPSPGGHRMSIDNGDPREHNPYGPRHPYSPPHDGYPRPSHEGYPPPPQHAYPPPPQDHQRGPDEIYPRPDRHPMARGEYDHPVDPNIAPRPYYADPHEAHLADALQRENRGYGEMQPRNSYVTLEDDDENGGQYDDYGAPRDPGSQQEIDRRKRKRIFSNRTKTGCMTCRRRKKKCDEQHPECNNCIRGGFVCEGYNTRNTWQKPTNAKQPIPLQSKNGYPVQQGPSGRAPYAPASSRYDASPEYPPPPPPPHHRPSYDAGRPGPPPPDDDIYARADPQAKAQNAWNKAARPYPSNPPQASKYQGEHDPREHRGSIYEMAPESTDPHAMHAQPPDTRNGSNASQYPPPHNGTPAPHTNVQAAAQAALTHPASLRPSPSNRRNENLTEREKMLKGLYYLPNTLALIADRENCIQHIWRFNNATNPSHGASPEERIRLFKQILTLRPTPEPPLRTGEPAPSNGVELPFGSVGENVIVEAPFHCDYGYNITVGDNVLIGADCRISDTCSVTIGARTIFSPNVKLICATYPIDPRRRSGSGGPALGRNIVIEEDCWIGANVTILAGVRVGKSSTVGAGSLLHQDVPRFTVVAGNPAKVSRGIYDGSQEP